MPISYTVKVYDSNTYENLGCKSEYFNNDTEVLDYLSGICDSVVMEFTINRQRKEIVIWLN